MKDSGIPWVGEIPAEWEVGRIGGLYKHRNQKVSDVDFPPLSVTMKGVVPQLETAAKSDDHDNRKLVKAGDFAINSRSDRRGSCGVSTYDGSVSLINTVLEPREVMCPAFYNLLFHTTEFADEFYKWGHGIVDDLWTTRWQDMKAMKVPLPPLGEQQRIADYLDERCSAIDEVRRTIEDEIEALRRLRKATIHRAVTKGLDEGVPMKDSGVEWIGEISETWEARSVKQVCQLKTGTTPPSARSDLFDGNCTWYTPGDINNGILGPSERTVSEQAIRERVVPVYPKHSTLVIAIGGTAGKVGYATEQCSSNQQLTALMPNEEMVPKFLFYQFVVLGPELKNMACFTTLPILNNEFLGSIRVVVPSIVEQQLIADYLDERCAAIDSVIDTRTRQLERLDDYRRALVFAYVTGKKEVPSHE